MLAQLQEISKVIAIPVAALYFLGFVCVMGYLSRFGIVTFEIVNARFLIAGLFVLLALAMSLFSAWHIFRLLADVRSASIERRLFTWGAIIIIPLGMAAILSIVFAAGRRLTGGADVKFQFHPAFGEYDLFARLLTFPMSDRELEWLVKTVLNGWLYALASSLLISIALGFVLIVRRVQVWFVGAEQSGAGATTTAEARSEHSVAVPPSATREGAGLRWLRRSVLPLVEIPCVLLALLLVFYSYLKLRAELVDVSTVGTAHALDISLLFAWVYGTAVSVVVALWISQIDFSDVFSSEGRIARDPAKWPEVVQWLVAPVLLSVFIFGGSVFPRIPFSIGGGEPREVVLQTSDGDWEGANIGRKYLLGETSQYFYVVSVGDKGGTAFQLSKSIVKYIQTHSDVPVAKTVPLPVPKPQNNTKS